MNETSDTTPTPRSKHNWLLLFFGVALLFLAGYGATMIARRMQWPWTTAQAASENSDAVMSAFVDERSQPDFAADPQYQRASVWAAAAQLDAYAVLENVNVETGENSLFRELARGVVRVDTLYEIDGVDGKPAFGAVVCSGFLASAKVVVTAKHCIDNTSEGYPFAKLKSARVVLDYLRDGDPAVSTLQIDVLPGSIKLGPDNGRAGDYAFLRIASVSQPEVSNDRVLSTAVDEDLNGQNLFVLHHALGRPLHLTQAGCRSGGEDADGAFEHTCLTFGGSSGAPVFSQRSARVVGIHVAGDEEHTGQTTNRGYFVPLRLLWPELEEATGGTPKPESLPGSPQWPGRQ